MEINQIKSFNLNLLQIFVDHLLEKKNFKKLKIKLEKDISVNNIKNIIDYIRAKIEKSKILPKLQLKDQQQIDFILSDHNCNSLIQFNLYYDPITCNNRMSLTDDNIHSKLFDNYHNKKYLKFNNSLLKGLKNSIEKKDISWKTFISNGKIHFFRYTPQILLIRN